MLILKHKKKIKIIFLIIIGLIINSEKIFSQSNYGITGGINYCKLFGNEAPEYQKPLLRYNTGAFAEFKWGDKANLQFDIKYDLKGGILWDSIKHFINGYYEVKEKNDYLTFSITYKYNIKQKNSKIFLLYGGSASYLALTERTFYAESAGVPVDASFLFSYQYKPYSLDIYVGWGVGFNSIDFDLKYVLGMTSVYGGENAIVVRNSVISANMYYKLVKRKKTYSW